MYILYLCNLKCIADNICMLIYTLIMFVYITIICKKIVNIINYLNCHLVQ